MNAVPDTDRTPPAWPSEEARLRFRAHMRKRLQREPTPEARRALAALRNELGISQHNPPA